MTKQIAPRPAPTLKSTQELLDLGDYVRRIEKRPPDVRKVNLYRGHGTLGHVLTPGLFRTPANRKHEKNLLRELVSIHPSEFAADQGVFEHIVRMQHFSLPTRLLDLTSNPLIALYFCCVDSPASQGEVIRIVARAEYVKYHDSDTVSCVANLANLSAKERNELGRAKNDVELSESKAGKRLLQFVRSEKPYFLPEIKRSDLDSPLVVKPRLSNRRLLAQQGAFLLFGLHDTLTDDNECDFEISRMTVSSSAKRRIRGSLDKIGINESTMFPELASAARYIMSKVTPSGDDESGP